MKGITKKEIINGAKFWVEINRSDAGISLGRSKVLSYSEIG